MTEIHRPDSVLVRVDEAQQHETESLETSPWHFLQRVVEPDPRVREIDRFRVRILASLLAILIPMAVASFFLTLPSEQGLLLVLIAGAVILLSVAYVLSRSRFYRLAAALTVGITFIATLLSASIDRDASYLGYLIISVLVASLYFSWRGTALAFGMTLSAILIWPFLFPRPPASAPSQIPFLVVTISILAVVSATIQQKDIDQIEAQSQRIRSRELHFRTLIENSSDAVVLSGADGTITYASPAITNILGYSVQGFVGRQWADMVHPDDVDLSMNIFIQLLQSPNDVRGAQWRVSHKDGSWRWIEAKTANHLGESAVRAVVTNLRDITDRKQVEIALRQARDELAERVEQRTAELQQAHLALQADITDLKQAEEALQAAESRYRRLVTELDDGIFAADAQAKVTFANPALARILGFGDPELLVGTDLSVLILPSGSQQVAEDLRRRMQSDLGHEAVTIEIAQSDGKNALLEITSTLQVEGGQVVGMRGVVRDITARKQAEQRAFELALERERVAFLTKFIKDASHEFRTPLSIMRSNLYLLNRLDDPIKLQRKLLQMSEQVTGITRLVDLLVEITRLDSDADISLSPTDVNELVFATAEKFRSAVEAKGLALELDLMPGLPPVAVDGTLIGKAVHELLDNAVRFTSAGGRITVRTASGAGAHDGVVVEVRDTGPGIPSDVRPRIFERFYRQDAAHTTSGFGLGLPIARSIIERHGGRLDVESEVGTGSVFRIVLPLPVPPG